MGTISPVSEQKLLSVKDLVRQLLLSLFCVFAVIPSVLAESDQDYAPKPVLSLIVSGKNERQIKQCLESLVRLQERQRVQVGEVIIVGGMKKFYETKNLRNSSEQKHLAAEAGNTGPASAPSPFRRDLGLLGMNDVKVAHTKDIVERFNLTHSPAWVVRHLGRDYVFEGFSDPSAFFNYKGEFIRADY